MRVLVLPVLLWGFASLAQRAPQTSPDMRDFQHSRNVAMGGAYEAMGYGVEAVGGNPAALSLYKRYQIEATGSWDPPQGYGFFSLGIADSTNPVAMGLTYHFATYGTDQRRWAHVTTLGTSYAIVDLFHIGVSVRHQVLVGASNTNSVTMNAGLLVRPVSFLTLGFSGHNLVSVYNPDVSRYFVASVAAQLFGQLSPAVDVRLDFNQPTPRYAVHGGLEWLIAQVVPVRVGYQYDAIAGHQYLSAGIGWFVEGSGIDFGYRHELGGQEGRLLSLTLKLQM